MKHFYSIVSLFILLFIGTSCEDDYRGVILFEGAEPIYQLGTCDNLVSSVALYLTEPEGRVLGIDGGDGEYMLSSGNASVATVDFAESTNGYQRICVIPKGEGKTNLTIKDGSGASVVLSVQVSECYKKVWRVTANGFGYKGGNITDDTWEGIRKGLGDLLIMKMNGRYELIPVDGKDLGSGGVLRVYPDTDSETPFVGTFDLVRDSEMRYNFHFYYNDEVHIFSNKDPLDTSTRSSVAPSLIMWEEVTSLSPVALPEDCQVYHAEQWGM